MNTQKKLTVGSQDELTCELCGKIMKNKCGLIHHTRSHDPADKEARSKRAKEIWNRPGMHEKRSEIAFVSQNLPAVKEKREEGQKLANLRPEVKKKRSEAAKRHVNQPGVREKIAETTRLQWKNEDIREKMQNGLRAAAKRADVKYRRSKAAKELSAKAGTKERRQRISSEIMARPGTRERARLMSCNPAVCKKRHETMKRNGTYGKISKPESLLKSFLELQFGTADIVCQAYVHKWPIDFYIKSMDLYVQLDGVYWHGLDRSLEEIEKCKTPRDKQILRKMKNDVEQNVWFVNNEKRLIRITDNQINTLNFSLNEILEFE